MLTFSELLALDQEEAKTRTLEEIETIVWAVRSGIPMRVEYWDGEDEDADNEYIYKACW